MKKEKEKTVMVGKEKETSKIMDLNLILDYPVNWSKYKVLRDFIQNFYDAIGYKNWEKDFSYSIENNICYFIGKDIGFSYDWLIPIGASTKREDPDKYAGHFGEGFKIASLCAVRDYNWGIEMSSRNWELQVMISKKTIDGKKYPSLAYRLWEYSKTKKNTTLVITSFNDKTNLISALQSFFYAENPLFGKKIWSSQSIAIYQRSSHKKPENFPSTYNDHGEGIIYASYQALGSFPFPLIIAKHNHPNKDRERNSFYKMDVVKIIESISSKVAPHVAFILLESFKRLWYAYPSKKYDFASWHFIIYKLCKNIAQDAKQTKLWKEKYPLLLVAKPMKRSKVNIPEQNKRSQALSWLHQQVKKYQLVQDGFLFLNYPILEELCEKDNGFVQTRLPKELEGKLINVLEDFVNENLKYFFGPKNLPTCKIINNNEATWQGMANCIQLTSHKLNIQGIKIKYRIPYVALKARLLQKENFYEALSTYLHELAHIFGGDNSRNFSEALTVLLEKIIENHSSIKTTKLKWEKIISNDK